MITRLRLGDITVDVALKNIKNVHLSVHPPTGRVRISAPSRMKLDTIRVFAISKIGWIKKQQAKLAEQEREAPREFLNRESHYLWGKRYLLKLAEGDGAPTIELAHNRMILTTRPGTDAQTRQAILAAWHREQLKVAVPQVIAKWEPLIAVRVERFFVRRMRTKWGSCNPRARSIRLNSELAKKPRECLEYVVVHEMVHILEPTHNARFVALMDGFMPRWRFCRDALNRLALSHEDWPRG